MYYYTAKTMNFGENILRKYGWTRGKQKYFFEKHAEFREFYWLFNTLSLIISL